MKTIICLTTLTAALSASVPMEDFSSSSLGNDFEPSYKKEIPFESNDKKESFTYGSVGAAIPMPTPHFLVGRREKFDDKAVDISVGFSTAFVASSISGNLSFLNYLNKAQFYTGAGVGIEVVTIPVEPFLGYGLTSNFYLGKENEKSFHQIKASPMCISNHGVFFSPHLVYQYGFKF